MKKLILLPLLLLTSVVFSQTRDFTRWVNPFIGTGGHGHTFPGATLPFGMVQLSPDTRIDNWDGSSGYHYSDDVIYGFSHTHLSGTGIPDGCDILVMPTIDVDKNFSPNEKRNLTNDNAKVLSTASSFYHADEEAQPGYYSVKLNDRQLLAEMTSTTRVGFHRYTFPESKKAGIDIDLMWRDKLLDSDLKIIGDRRIEGFRRSSSWAKDEVVYFVAEFSKPFEGYSRESRSHDPRHYGALFLFDTSANEQILLKVAISFVSIEGARANLAAELPGWDFDKVRADAKAAWNKELSKIEVSGGTDDQTTIFYTGLYHTMIHPNVFNDVDGKYLGHDRQVHQLTGYETGRKGEGEKGRGGDRPSPTNPKSKIQNPKSGEQYTVFSLWDTFRAAHPLYTIIDQKRTADFINTFIRIYEQGGRLPVWELWGEETDTMIGYHAVSVIADAMSKGIEGFDYEKAYKAAKHSAELDHFGLGAYKKRGYVSSEDDNESVSKTLEYAYDDWCVAQMARAMMRKFPSEARYKTDFALFEQRSRQFENLFDPETGFFRPKRNGGFIKPFAPNEVTFNFTEGNSWQYSFFVPHNVARLIELYGGRGKFIAKLDELFTTEEKLTGREQPDITGLIGQYAHGNEPSHHIPYLYAVAGEPWKTQGYVRRIMQEFYKNSPDGLIGNEDCGQMSAWYVLSASGLYPLTPGYEAYTPGLPLFREVKFNLENGKSFSIHLPRNPTANEYVRPAKLNGAPTGSDYVSHSMITAGGLLEFETLPIPNTAPSTLPFFQRASPFVAVPIIDGDRIFKNETIVTLRSVVPGSKITYTIDNNGGQSGRRTQIYAGPFTIKQTSKVEAYATDGGRESKIAEAIFQKRSNDWTVKIVSPYSYQYTGGGDDAIVDGIRGTANFTTDWQGYQGRTFEAVIDLQRETPISLVGGSFLQSARSWIWMPDRIEFEVSNDNVNFTRVAEIKPGFPQQQMEPEMKEFTQAITPTHARYVRVRAFNFGKIPSWHPGAGGDPWIFVDEILIR